MRPSFDTTFMLMARTLALRSSCERLRVGAIMTSKEHNTLLSGGYNGNAAGFKNACTKEPGNCHFLHAEINTILNYEGTKQPSVLYVTHLPCPTCAQAIIAYKSITKVVYRNTYRNNSAIKMFKQAKIQLIHHKA